MKNHQSLSIWYIGNCGILTEYQGHQFLVDGLYHRPPEAIGQPGLCDIPEEEYQDLIHRRGRFSKIEYLLFTHTHWDHCEEKAVSAYQKNYHIPVLFPSEDGSDYTVETPFGTIESLTCPHDLPSNPDSKTHCAFRVTVANQVLLFTGDMDVTKNEIPKKIYEKPVDYLFYNVHHVLHETGRKVAKELINPKHCFIQHLPLPDSDPSGLNRRLANKLKIYRNDMPPCTALDHVIMKL